MAVSPPGGWGPSVTTLAVFVGAAVAALQTGTSDPGAALPTPEGATAVFAPTKLTVVTTRHLDWPFRDTWSQTASVLIRTAAVDQAAMAIKAGVATQLSSDDGRQLPVTLRTPVCVNKKETAVAENSPVCPPNTDSLRATLEMSTIEGPGEYRGTLALNPLDESSAALDLTVKARHPAVLPLVILFLGALASAFGTLAYNSYRDRRAKRVPGVLQGSRRREQPPVRGGAADGGGAGGDMTVEGGVNDANAGGVPKPAAATTANRGAGWSPTRWLGDLVHDAGGKRRLALDVSVYVGALLLASVAFLLPIYATTNFGTWEHYLSAFVAGLVGKVVVDEGLSFVRGGPAAKGAVAEAGTNQPAPPGAADS